MVPPISPQSGWRFMGRSLNSLTNGMNVIDLEKPPLNYSKEIGFDSLTHF
jgi:hypothetical protein